MRQTLDDAAQEAEVVREDARVAAGRIRASAEAEAVRLRAEAQKDADELLHQARERAEQVRRAFAGEGLGPHTPGVAAGSSNSWWRQGEGLALRPAIRPLAAGVAVAALATTVILTGDSIIGTSGDCRAQGADQLISRADLQGRGTVQQAAFVRKPEAIITFPPNYTPRPIFGFPSGPASSPSPEASPTPSAEPTPSPTPTPSTSPTPTASPAQDRRDPCAKKAHAR
ncbi:hypothetical protein [Streptomyces sp. NBC_01546]|uniref:hypothetical protein n=1 Tax=Streptomyces sp. NBC_01546 TaxID=2975872 RepID=UPI0038695393